MEKNCFVPTQGLIIYFSVTSHFLVGYLKIHWTNPIYLAGARVPGPAAGLAPGLAPNLGGGVRILRSSRDLFLTILE